MDIKVDQEVIYCGQRAIVKVLAEHKNTALVISTLFTASPVWVPITQLKPFDYE